MAPASDMLLTPLLMLLLMLTAPVAVHCPSPPEAPGGGGAAPAEAAAGCNSTLAEPVFLCEDGRCVSAAARCNGLPDCAGGEDESVAECGCLPNEFRCSNTCVDLVRRCDRSVDCAQAEDEQGCEAYVCPHTHFKCRNHFCVPDDRVCDFVDDCGDASDEQKCSHRKCWKTEFTCSNGECIRPGFVCDRTADCHDGSDEENCTAEHFVTCSNGHRVHRHYWCDGWPDCPDNHADELNCGGACAGPADFLCPNGRCIRRSNVCDSQCDCAAEAPGRPCWDERGCDTYAVQQGVVLCDEARTLTCSMPEGRSRALARCVRPQFVCDGVNDCHNGNDPSDELGCAPEPEPEPGWERDVVCSENRTLPGEMRCDFKRDCLGGEDERGCDPPACPAGWFRCANGQCVRPERRCDLAFHCWDKSDELGCEAFACPEGSRPCARSRQCLAERLWCDHRPDCPDLSDESDCGWPERCGPGEFACASGQCVPLRLRCYISGAPREGCSDGSHLLGCGEWQCNSTTFKCRNGPCLERALVCDGRPDCPYTWLDEEGCVFQCSDAEPRCQCQDRKANCSGLGLRLLPLDIEEAINRYILAENFLNTTLNEDTFADLDRLVHLNLRNNSISWLPPMAFRSLWRLLTLDLSDNDIHTISNSTFYGLSYLTGLHLEGNKISVLEGMAFYGLTSLTTLDLRHQRISNISKGAFIGLRNLAALYLSYNSITYLVDGSFNGLPKLHSLDISNNNIKTIGSNVFRSTTTLRELSTDEFRFCCLARHVERCLPPPDEFSSCEDLMSNLVLRVCVWVLGAVATVGNALVIAWRTRYKHTNQVHSFLITNLAIGDLFMGSYLLIIAAVDARYRGVYFIHDSAWRSSELCSLAGFISTFSSELSVFTLTVITLDRFLVIIFPFRVRRLEMPKTRALMAAGWVGAAVLSGLPLLQLDYFRNFYGRSGVCLALHITPEKPSGWEYSVFVFLFLNLVSFSIIALGYVWMYAVARTTRQAVCSKEQRPSDAAMARRMTLIVATDAACWMPIILLGALSLGGITVPPQVFAWVAVFVLPLNAAVNPVLYTLSTAPFLGPARRGLRTFKRSCKLSLTLDQRRTYSSSLGSTYAHNCSRYDVDYTIGNNVYIEAANGKQSLDASPAGCSLAKEEEPEPEAAALFAMGCLASGSGAAAGAAAGHRWRAGAGEGPGPGSRRVAASHHTIDTAVSARGEIIPLRRLSPDK